MPQPLTVEAVCLRTRNWHNSSCILSLFTREIGLIPATARGARRPKSRLGAVANLFTHSRLLLYPPRAGDLFLITEAELLNSFPGLSHSYENLTTASQISEFLLAALPPRQPEERLFQLLLTYLEQLAQLTPEHNSAPILLLFSFLLKALTFLGYRPELGRCARCRRELEPQATFDPQLGALLCTACARTTGHFEPALGSDQLQFLKKLLHTPASQLARLKLAPRNPVSEPAVVLTLLGFIRHHYPGRKFPLLYRLAPESK
jgi:DNA repair protein RecO (recombination protein O)